MQLLPLLSTQQNNSLASWVEPMQAKLVTKLPEAADWLYELKLDGYRALAIRNGDSIALVSRNRTDLSRHVPKLIEQLRQLKARQFVLDGEIVALDEKGRPSFQLLQNTWRSARPASIYFYAFDVLNLKGRDLMQLPIEERKELLDSTLSNAPTHIRLCAPLTGQPATVLAAIEAHGLEGIVAKRRGSLYEAGQRRGTWVKYKVGTTQEFVIGGYMTPEDDPRGFRSLLVGSVDSEGRLHFASKVGSGFADRVIRHFLEGVEVLKCRKCPFVELPLVQKATSWTTGLTRREIESCVWLEPVLHCKVQFIERTAAGHLRHPVFRGFTVKA